MKFVHIPHPRHKEREGETPVTVSAQAGTGFNARLALWITEHTGSMVTAYAFAVIGVVGIVASLTNNTTVVLIVAAVSGYFLQLVLLPVILLGQNLQANAADARAEATYKDASAVLAEALSIQKHLEAQDAELTKQTELLSSLVSRATK